MSNYMPGAVQSPQPGGVTLDTSLPPRFVWHITWDKLDANGRQPQFSAVANYLKNVGYCPHIMWNPFTGEMEQYYPANVGARALAYNNQDGAACIQVEVFFTPGCVVDGIKYDTVADTPLKGWAELLAWADSLGVPRTWPMGAPQWAGNSRDVGTWNGQAGHYGHCNSPGDNHTDPGPMPALTGITVQGTITPTTTPAPEADMKAILATDGTSPDVWIGDGITRRKIATLDTLNSITYLKDLFGLDPTVQTVHDLWALGYPVDQAIESNIAGIPLAVLSAQFRTKAGAVANVAGAFSELLSQPAVTNVTAAVDVDALVARLKAELPPAVLAELRTQLAK